MTVAWLLALATLPLWMSDLYVLHVLVITGIFDSSLGFLELTGRVAITDRWAVVGGLRWGLGVMPWVCVEAQLL